MRALDRKLLRDLGHLRGQLVTIALVVAAGIASYVSLRGAHASLEQARATYYAERRFADVFVHLEHAPGAVAQDIGRLPGVAVAEPRLVEGGMVPLPDVESPIRAQLVSLPRTGQPRLNQLAMVAGRSVEPDHADEVVVLQSFARAHRLAPGDRLPVVINGTLRRLQVVGVARSPEFILAVSPGELAPDPGRFAVLFLGEDALAAAFRLEGAFNDLSLTLQPGASPVAVRTAVDRLLAPFGGTGAVGRDKQPSNAFVTSELRQLASTSAILPGIFLLVAALLVNVVLSRLVHLQRPEIATLKAVGYSDAEVGLHFFLLVLALGALGAVGGVLLGAWFGGVMMDLYARFFVFPDLAFRIDPAGAATAVLVSLGAAWLGAASAVRRVVRLAPAEAMRPESPARYRPSLVDRLGWGRTVGPVVNMIVRELERRPLRTALSAFAIAASIGLMVIGAWYYDGMRALVDMQFGDVMREDVAVSFRDARPARAVREVGHLPGVLRAEGLRAVPVHFRVGHVSRDGALLGYAEDAQLRWPHDKEGRAVVLPPEGVVLTATLASILGIGPGDAVAVEVLEGQRPRGRLTVAGLVDDSFGLQGHLSLGALRAFLGEEDRRSLALLRVDPRQAVELDRALKDMPHVAAVTRRAQVLRMFEEQSAGMLVTMAVIITLLAATITVGVVYNNARVALSLRARDLASLRVLGFSRGEVSTVLLGEMAVPVLLALVPGVLAGEALVHLLAATIDPETYRLPIIITARSRAMATLVALISAGCSALLVRRRLDRLDLIGVLKTRE